MNSNILNLRNISLSKTKQEKDILLNPNSQRETISAAKSLIKDKKLNKSHVKEREKSPLMKLTTKTNFDNINNKKREFNLHANKDMKKNLTHKLFDQINNKINNNLNIKQTQTQTIINNIKKFDIINDKYNNKENKDFKIKVKKVFDLNELMTVYNITNDNTTSSNKNKENKTLEKFENFKHNILNKLDKEKFIIKESDCAATEAKVAKDLETRKSLILKEFPIFKNSFIINENASFTNNLIDIETLPNMKYSEIDSLNESSNGNASNSSSMNKNNKNNLNKSDKINENPTEKRKETDIEGINNDKNLSLDENANANLDDNCGNKKQKKTGTTIKETFTLFLQNNSKKEFLNEENSVNGQEEKEKNRSNFKNKTLTMTNSNTNAAFREMALNQNIKISENIRKTPGIERINLTHKLSNNFYSPQKNRMRFCKTKNVLSSFSNSVANFNNYNNNSISELSQKVANCDSMLSYIELNKKLKSEAEILSEKVKTLKKIQQNKNHEIEILKSKYSEAIESYKSEIEKNKKLKERIDKQNSLVKNLKKNFKLLANNLVELTELLLLSKSSAEKRASLIAAENASLSIDIYDSYNNEEEKKSLLQEQIQSLLLGKFYYFKKQLSLDLEAEIDRIKNWNNNPNFLFSGKNNNSNNNVNNSNNTNNNNNIEMSISNIKITALNKNNENDSFESSSKKNISQDYFDLSISNQFLNLNHIPSGNFGNLGSNINININQSPQIFFTNNNYNSKKNPHNNSFGVIDGESENIFGSNSNKNYNSNANNYNNNNLNLNSNASNNAIINANNNLLNNYFSNKEKSSSSNIKNINNFGSKEHNNINFNNSNSKSKGKSNSNNNKNKWTLIFNKEEQMDINNSNWNKLNYNSNNREEKFRIDSINNLIGTNGINRNVALSSNYNSNSNNIFDSFLQSAKGPNDSFSNSANDSILQIVNLNNANSDKENKHANKSNKHLLEVEILNGIANDSLGKVSNPVDLKEQITKIQNDSYNFMFEESKARSENYNSDNETKKKFICDELVNNNNSSNNNEIENFKDNFSEKNDGNKLKRMFSFEL